MAWNGFTPKLITCHFQSALFLTDSQLALSLFFTTSALFQPKSFGDIWALSDSLYSRVALSLKWVPDHAGLPGNEPGIPRGIPVMSKQTLLLKPEQHFNSIYFRQRKDDNRVIKSTVIKSNA